MGVLRERLPLTSEQRDARLRRADRVDLLEDEATTVPVVFVALISTRMRRHRCDGLGPFSERTDSWTPTALDEVGVLLIGRDR